MNYKNQEMQLEITAMSNDGNGIAHFNDIVVFVVGAVTGDTVIAHVIKSTKNYLVAKVKEIIKPSSIRIQSNCDVSIACGGCAYRNISYEEELKIKSDNVYNCIKRIGKVYLKPKEIIFGDRDFYRNKASYPINKNLEFGFYADKTHRIVPNHSCIATPKIFEDALDVIQEFLKNEEVSAYNEIDHTGCLRHVVFRYGEFYNQLMITLVIHNDEIENKDKLVSELHNKLGDILKSVYININNKKTNVIFGDKTYKIFGDDTIKDNILGIDFFISPLSFYQINRKMTERLYSKTIEYANAKDKIVYDLYCGAGTISLNLAKFAKKVVGIEIIPDAIKDAKNNAELNNITNCDFVCGDALKMSLNIDEKPDVVVVDPPRKGVEKALLERISTYYNPQRIVYVSCDPATLARDVEILTKFGYCLKEYTLVNMFPATKHIETVSLLTRESTVHSMNLNSEPFSMIDNGTKTIELRLFDEKRKQININDLISFTNNVTNETILTKVLNLHIFKNFDELYKNLPLLKCGYTSKDIDKASAVDMLQYYSAEEQNKYGVIGIEIMKL